MKEVLLYAAMNRPYFRKAVFREDDALYKAVLEGMKTKTYMHFDGEGLQTNCDYNEDTCVFLVKDGVCGLIGTRLSHF